MAPANPGILTRVRPVWHELCAKCVVTSGTRSAHPTAGALKIIMFGKYGLWTAAALAALALTGCNRGEETLATVNGDPITMEEFIKHIETKPTVRVVVDNRQLEVPVANTIAFQGLQDLVTQKLIIQMARDKGFKLDDTAVQAEIATLEKINPGYVKNLQARGLTMEQIRQSIRVDLAQEHLLTEGIKISDQQVDKFIKDSPNAFLKPAMAEVVQIVVRDERSKQRADNLLRQGRNFTDVAREVNPQNVPSRSELNLTAMKAQVAAPVVRTLYTGLTTTAPGRATAWIKLADNEQVKYLVERRTQESKIEITKERRERIRRDLAKAQGAQAVDLNDRIAKRLKDSTVSVDKSYLKGMWERFMETFGEALKEQEAKTGTTAGN